MAIPQRGIQIGQYTFFFTIHLFSVHIKSPCQALAFAWPSGGNIRIVNICTMKHKIIACHPAPAHLNKGLTNMFIFSKIKQILCYTCNVCSISYKLDSIHLQITIEM
jgi:hypothetical protein